MKSRLSSAHARARPETPAATIPAGVMRRKTGQADEIRLEAKRKRIADEVAALLRANRGSEAVMLFTQGDSQGICPEGEALKQWLYAALGEELAVQLIRTYAQWPCSFCTGGLQSCAECDQHGHFDYAEVCEGCLGLGVCSCYFCNGSGLGSLEDVPAGLRAPVILERARAAISRMRELLSRLPPAEPAETDPRDALKQWAGIILRLNGLLGNLENEISDAEALRWWTPRSRQWVKDTARDWVAVAAESEQRICEAFAAMSATARRMADEAVEGSNAQKLALARAEYFARFDTPEALERTVADHPMFDRVLEMLVPNGQD
jgi:hypothetical protein